jgi:hypothetical protein
METKLLFPNRFKKLGWVLFIIGLLLTIIIEIEIFPIHLNNESVITKWTTIKSMHPIPFIEKSNNNGSREPENIVNELAMSFVAIGFILVAFTREKKEDEYISKIRSDSFVWSFYLYVMAILIAIWTSYSLDFIFVITWLVLLPPIIFVLRFHWFVYLKPYFESRKEAKL